MKKPIKEEGLEIELAEVEEGDEILLGIESEEVGEYYPEADCRGVVGTVVKSPGDAEREFLRNGEPTVFDIIVSSEEGGKYTIELPRMAVVKTVENREVGDFDGVYDAHRL